MGKKHKCMADGGLIGADGLTDAQREKKNATLRALGMSTTAPTPQPAPAPAPAPAPTPQPAATGKGIMGILRGRQEQIDKASGYAEGGIVRGKGGVDNVPMSVGGVDVNLTGGKLPEAVLPGKTVKALGGPGAVEALIEATNGKPPVRNGLKSGGKYAGGSVLDEEDKDKSNNIAGRWFGGSSVPTIGGADQSGEYINALKTEPSLFNYINRGDPVKDVGTGIANLLSDSSKAARGNEGTYDEIVAARKARESGQALGSPLGAQAIKPDASADSVPYGGTSDIPSAQNYSNEGRSVPQRITKSNPGVVVDNENQFTQGGKTYTSVPTSQQGISRITAPGTSPLYTNIKPENAVSGLINQPAPVGQPSVQIPVKQATKQPEGIASIERSNQIRGEMIDSAIKANGGNGVGVLQTEQTLPGGMSISDWNNRVSSGFNTQMSPQQKAAYLASEGAQGIQRTGQDLLNQQAAARDALAARGQDMQNERAASHDKVLMRGQDISALSDKAKLAMLERNDQRQMDKFNLDKRIAEGALADSEAQRTARNNLNAAIAFGDPAAISKAHTMAVASGLKFDREDKGIKPIEIADPTDKAGMRKILVQPNSDGTYTQMQAKQAAPQQSVPEGVVVPKGHTFEKMVNGKPVFRTADGKLVWEQ